MRKVSIAILVFAVTATFTDASLAFAALHSVALDQNNNTGGPPSATGTSLDARAKQDIIDEWMKKSGFARVDLNNIQIRPDFHMTRDFDPKNTVPRGSRIAVRTVAVDEERRSLDIDVREAASKRWTEVHLVLLQPIGSSLTSGQTAELNAMWARLISSEPVDTIVSEHDASVDSADRSTYATVHIYRPKVFVFGGRGTTIACDWLDIGKLDNGRYITALLPPGSHEFFIMSLSEQRVSFSLEAAREYYLHEAITMKGVTLKMEPAEEAVAAIRKLRYADASDIRDRQFVKTQEQN